MRGIIVHTPLAGDAEVSNRLATIPNLAGNQRVARGNLLHVTPTPPVKAYMELVSKIQVGKVNVELTSLNNDLPDTGSPLRRAEGNLEVEGPATQ